MASVRRADIDRSFLKDEIKKLFDIKDSEKLIKALEITTIKQSTNNFIHYNYKAN